MAKQWNFYDSGGVLRKVTTPYLYDSGGVLRKVKDGYFYDSGGVLRHFFSGTAPPLASGSAYGLTVGGQAANSGYGTGIRSALAGQTHANGGGIYTAGAFSTALNVCTPSDPVMPFAQNPAKFMMAGNAGVGGVPGTAGGVNNEACNFLFGPAAGSATPWQFLRNNYTFLTVRYDDNSDWADNKRTANFGAVEFVGTNLGPLYAKDAIYLHGTYPFYLANYATFGTWMWPKVYGFSNGDPLSLVFSDVPAYFSDWVWTQVGASRSITSYYNATAPDFAGTWTTQSSTGSLYAPVGSNYYSAGQGTLTLNVGVVPAGLQAAIRAVHFSGTAANPILRIFTNEAEPWTVMPNTMNSAPYQGSVVSQPQLVTFAGYYRMGTSGVAVGCCYTAQAQGYTPVTNGNQLQFY
jgi:hypothetical protein